GGLEDIKSVFEYVIKKLRDEDREGTALAYGNALSSLIKYKNEFITFNSISPEWLRGYEKWALKAGLSINSIGMYLRALRVIFNTAIDLKIITHDLLPFGRRRYIIPSAKRRAKKAFSRAEKNLILSHRSERMDVNRALDYWTYQYLSSGCNMADVAY